MIHARRAALAVLVLLGLASAAPAQPATPATGPTAAELDALRAQVSAQPDDVDLRMRLASNLSWADRRAEARAEALEVLARAPAYLDAEVLLARLAAWDADWADARRRLTRVLAADPAHLDARLLAVDVAIWSGDHAAARRGLAQIRPGEIGEAEHLYRQAQVALATHDHRRAVGLARKILALDPKHGGARGLVATVSLVSVESASELELYPDRYPDRLAGAETITATIFPRSRWSVTLAYEYRRRYGLDNHRFAARGDWRVTDRWTVFGYLRGGAAEILPTITAIGEARWDHRGWTLGGRPAYDRMPWGGSLYRLHGLAGAPLPQHLRIDVEGMLGALRGCATNRVVWSARGRLTWSPRRWDVAASYLYGLEADRAISGPSPCVSGAPLVDHAVQAISLGAMREVSGKLSAGAAYSLELRPYDVRVHVGVLTLRTWF